MVLFDYNRAFWDNLFQLAWGMVYCMPLFGLLLIGRASQ